jgi:hypothetical protein
MIVNNSCDLVPGRAGFVTVAPVFDLGKYLQAESRRRSQESLANYQREIRHNQISELFYFPGIRGFEVGAIVRLGMLCSVAASHLDDSVNTDSRVTSFTQTGFYVLLMKLTHHLTRSETSEVRRD